VAECAVESLNHARGSGLGSTDHLQILANPISNALGNILVSGYAIDAEETLNVSDACRSVINGYCSYPIANRFGNIGPLSGVKFPGD
jgi:hypothetical protein